MDPNFNFNLAALQFLAGGFGGLVRGLVGTYKSYAASPKTFVFDWNILAFPFLSLSFPDKWPE